MAKILYFDCLSGAGGDMILAALVDLGVPASFLNARMKRLCIPGLSVAASRERRGGIACTRMRMRWNTPKAYRRLPEILRIIRRGRFGAPVLRRCAAVLGRLAAAEAKAHGIPKNKVHFHEVGAVDTIADVAGVCLALAYLAIDEVRFSTLTEGRGTIRTEHGLLPVPAPATAELIRGFHVTRLDIPTELLTPTGAALLTTLGTQSLHCPAGVVTKTGRGCGTKTFETHPNFLRAMLVTTEDAPETGSGRDTVTVIETDMDHVSGEIMGNAGTLLMENGALDVSWMPLYMKKGRPGYRLTVIAPPRRSSALVDLVMIHTRTLGVRVRKVQRVIAERETKEIRFSGYRVSEKRCRYKGRVFSKIESDDLARIAQKRRVPVIELMEKYRNNK
ncbi:MAG: nickel pincer cofactor biosynthesis protein LarC [Chitinispirillaceae bacterium]|nr:nickel pincer cofactor biosynthesis protein LarC [Chitinispirillaceae bacterium]